MKFRSSMTLFTQVSRDNNVFAKALQKYFGGVPDQLTLDRLLALLLLRQRLDSEQLPVLPETPAGRPHSRWRYA